MNTHYREERHGSDSGTLADDAERKDERDKSRDSPSDGGEKGGEDESPKPVGFWHPGLKKTRLQIFGLWGRTSKLRCRLCTFVYMRFNR